MPLSSILARTGVFACLLGASAALLSAQQPPPSPSPILFELKQLPFQLESDMSPAFNAPESMAGGVAVFDYNGDGKPDIFFTNGADLATLKKSSPKYSDRLFRNNGDGTFTDVTEQAGLAGHGYHIGAAVADYDNDGHPDLFVAGVYGNVLYHNNGDGTFTDVTAKAGLDNFNDPQYGPLWSEGGAWVDVNNDGLLDLFVVNYMQWTYTKTPICNDYCHPRHYKPTSNQLFINQGDGTFKDVSKEWGLRDHLGKGMAVAVADYDHDGKPDLFVTNDALANFLFHNLGNKFEEVGFQTETALAENGDFISGMGADFRDFNNDGWPDITYVALNNQTFPLLKNTGKGTFEEITAQTGLRRESMPMSGYGPALFDFDNDGWKDLFVTRGQVARVTPPGSPAIEPNVVFHNPGASGQWQALVQNAGFSDATAAHHRGCGFADFDGDGRIDAVVTSLDKPAELWMNRSPGAHHWLDIRLRGTKSNRDGIGAEIKVVTKAGTQYNHQTSAVCYASSSMGPVHFGLGDESTAQTIEIKWPSGTVQTLSDVKSDRTIDVTEPEAIKPAK